MAATPQVSGVVVVKVDTGSSNALETLGYTEQESDVNYTPHLYRVHADSRGGEEGPPVDAIWMGATGKIDMMLSSWDEAVSDKVEPFMLGGTRGQTAAASFEPGTSLFGESKTFRLLLDSASEPLNYPRAVLVGFRRTKGSKYNRLFLSWEIHEAASGVLFNETDS